MESKGEIVIYRSQDGKLELSVVLEKDTVWLTQKQMANLFHCSSDNISLHLQNIFRDKELSEKSVTEESSVTASDGKKYKIKHYDLDAIISVGYRVNSKRGIQFRMWATKVLKEHIIKGFTINRNRLIEVESMYHCLKDTLTVTVMNLNKLRIDSARQKDLVVLMEDLEIVKRDLSAIKAKIRP